MMAKVALGSEALARLMPMHVIVDGDGRVVGAGPTLVRMCAPQQLRGRAFFDVFALRRPHGACTMSDLAASAGGKVQLEFRASPRTPFKGLFVRDDAGLFVFDLSFGLGVREAVAAYGLKATDFAATSLAVDMLFLVEANAAALAESRDLIRRLHEARADAERLARTDSLTGLGNRRALEAAIAGLADRGEAFGLMHVDLDYFKSVNDSFGHAAGDHVLSRVARLLEGVTRDRDQVIRLGGDEFAIVFVGMTDPMWLSAIASRILVTLDEPIAYGEVACRVSASIGITTSDLSGVPDVATLLRDADIALYRSKLRGRSRATVFCDGGDAWSLQPPAEGPLSASGGC